MILQLHVNYNLSGKRILLQRFSFNSKVNIYKEKIDSRSINVHSKWQQDQVF